MKSAFRYSFIDCYKTRGHRNLVYSLHLLLKTDIIRLETVNTKIQPAVPNQKFMLATNFSQTAVDLSRHQKVLSQIDILISVNLLINKMLVPAPNSLKVERQNQNDAIPSTANHRKADRQIDRHTEPYDFSLMYTTDINPFHVLCHFINMTSFSHMYLTEVCDNYITSCN